MKHLLQRFRSFCCWFLLCLGATHFWACEPPPPDESSEEEQAAGGCGAERWSVKTGTDADVSKVNFRPQNTTIADLVGIAARSPLPPNNRIAPYEREVFRLDDVTLTLFKLETDGDYHLVLSDGSRTMIAEIPSPSCVGESSPFLSHIQAARAAFDSRFTAAPGFNTANTPATVTGVGFFDFQHGQRGIASNSIELHAVLSICFGTGCDLTRK